MKRPDLFIYRKEDEEKALKLIESYGGEDELPFIQESDMADLLDLAICSIECENSLWVAEKMPAFGQDLRPMRRMEGKLGLPKNAVLPTVILKEEDRERLFIWERENKIPIHIWHVFFDRAFGLSLGEGQRLIDEGLILPTEQVFQALGGATSTKAIYKFYYHYAYQLGIALEKGITDNPGTISSDKQTINYTSFNKVLNISEGSDSIAIIYGPNLHRVKSLYYQNSTLAKTMYYSLNYEMEVTASDTIHRHYINSPYGLVAVKIRNGDADTLYFADTDHLGSIIALYRNDGTVAEQYTYDAWGKRRNPDDWSYDSVPKPTLLARGFTGHEHLDEFSLINMNGRIYDPVVGRFLSAEPVVQSPNFTQSYNAYSYCFNNPLKFTDPSGYVVVSFAAEGEEMNDWNTYVHLSLVEMVNEKFGDGILSDIENARRLFQEGGGTNKVKGTLKFERDGETGKIILRFIPENSLQDKLFKKDFLVFTGTQVPGKERIDGTLTWHRKTIFGNKIVDSWSANSGSITLKPIPKGTWYLSNWRPRDEPGYVAQNVGFTIDITPNQYGRSDLRIHPDGFPPGTAGCIGLTGDSKDLIRFSNMMRYFLIYNDFMRLEVDY